MPTLSCLMTNWKVTLSANCRARNDLIAEPQIILRFEIRAAVEFCRNRLVGCGAIRLRSTVHQIPGHRRLWPGRILLNASNLAPGDGFGIEPHGQSRDGALL